MYYFNATCEFVSKHRIWNNFFGNVNVDHTVQPQITYAIQTNDDKNWSYKKMHGVIRDTIKIYINTNIDDHLGLLVLIVSQKCFNQNWNASIFRHKNENIFILSTVWVFCDWVTKIND